MMTSHEIQYGGRPPYWNWFYRRQPGIIRFQWNLVQRWTFCFQGRLHEKGTKCCIFKMADGRYIKNRFLAISQRFIVRLTRNLVGTSIIMLRHRPFDQNTKYWKFKIVDGRHFENGFITISQLGIIQFQWNLVCRCKLCFQGRCLTNYQNFANSTWCTAAISKIVLQLYLNELLSNLCEIWQEDA